jgi:1-acyl-sn-glycerol-3-phosphate acyltransferase
MWLLFLVTSIVFIIIACLIWAVTILFDKKLVALHYFSCFWGSTYVWMNPLWKLRAEGRENVDSSKSYVMVCNHQSMLDILVLYRLFKPFKWVSKIELFKAPFVGWNMSLNRYIAVDRANKASHAKMFKDCERNIAMGNSIMIFPEGTRSKDGSLLPFKDGAFRIALSTKVDIVPIIMDGTANTLPKHGVFFKSKETIRLKILKPITYESFKDLTSKDVAQLVEDLMARELQLMRENYS